MKTDFVKDYLLLYIGVFVYSLCSVMNKLAAAYSFLSLHFCLFYGLAIFILAIYAVLWQQILKRLPLNTAYANRSLNMILVMLWGALLFEETITANMLIGAVIILFGVNLVVKADES